TGDAGASDAGTADAEAYPLSVASAKPHATASVRDDQTLYVADDALPLIHVIDLTTPFAPHELPPLVATSLVEPERKVTLGAIAVSPSTHDKKRYLYAVDRDAGSLIVFDVTSAPTAPRFPLRRPHAELNPFQPMDRLTFEVPVASVAFVKH